MSQFSDAVDTYLRGIEHVSPGTCPGCEACGLEDVDSMDAPEYEQAGEPSFSWSPCECCGSHLGGDRHPAHGFYQGEIIHLDVCVDCLFYLAYGDEPETSED